MTSLHWQRKPLPAQRAVCFDLENRPLAYWYDGQTTSEITAFGWKWDGQKKVHTMLLVDGGKFRQDDDTTIPYAAAYERFVAVLAEADLVYGHNIRRHDLPLLQGQLLRLKMAPLRGLKTSDTCLDYPRRKDLSASLENLAVLYGLSRPKMYMAQPDWEAANRLTDDGVRLARERVASDVVLQTELRAKLLELSLLSPTKVWNR